MFVAWAVSAGSPVPSSAGNEISEPPPATALTAPASSPAPPSNASSPAPRWTIPARYPAAGDRAHLRRRALPGAHAADPRPPRRARRARDVLRVRGEGATASGADRPRARGRARRAAPLLGGPRVAPADVGGPARGGDLPDPRGAGRPRLPGAGLMAPALRRRQGAGEPRGPPPPRPAHRDVDARHARLGRRRPP